MLRASRSRSPELLFSAAGLAHAPLARGGSLAEKTSAEIFDFCQTAQELRSCEHSEKGRSRSVERSRDTQVTYGKCLLENYSAR
jgi:hypothetical protein